MVKTAKLGSKTGRKMPVMYREVRIVREEIFGGIRAVWEGGGFDGGCDTGKVLSF